MVERRAGAEVVVGAVKSGEAAVEGSRRSGSDDEKPMTKIGRRAGAVRHRSERVDLTDGLGGVVVWWSTGLALRWRAVLLRAGRQQQRGVGGQKPMTKSP